VGRWVVLQLDKDGAIAGIGRFRFAEPLRIPKGIRHKREVYILSKNENRRELTFEIFFSTDSESAVYSWANRLADNYPVSTNGVERMAINKPVRSGAVWTAASFADINRRHYGFEWYATPGCSYINESYHDNHAAGSAALLFPGACSDNSPVLAMPRLIFLTATMSWTGNK
jgi:hypothetical protein